MTRTALLNCPINFNFNLILIYSIFTALVETKVSHIKRIHIYIYKENLAKLHKRTINYILEKKNYCSGEGLEGNIRTIRASPPKNYTRKKKKKIIP